MISLLSVVDSAIRAAGIPIDGVSIGDPDDRTTWRVQFLPAATAAQRTQAQDILNTVAVDAAALAAADADAQANADSQLRLARATVAYIWRVTHGGVNPTVAQLTTEMGTFKTIYKALP